MQRRCSWAQLQQSFSHSCSPPTQTHVPHRIRRMPILKSRRLLWEYGYSDLLLIIRQSIKRSGNESEVPPKVFCLTFGVYHVTYHRSLFTLFDMIETQRSCPPMREERCVFWSWNRYQSLMFSVIVGSDNHYDQRNRPQWFLNSSFQDWQRN